MRKESLNKILLVTLFAIAMSFIETVVVVYLRKIYYPEGFGFPLKGFIEPSIWGIEWVREIATIVMLVTIGLLAGKKFYSKLAYFIYAFAVWDIFYYIFLKVLLGWPASLFTWDLLFLIPLPWIGPVLTPILFSVLMIITAFVLIDLEDRNVKIKVGWKEFALIFGGIVLVLISWMWDYGEIIFRQGFARDFFSLATNSEFLGIVGSYSPSYYNWPLFLVGFGVCCLGVVLGWLRNRN